MVRNRKKHKKEKKRILVWLLTAAVIVAVVWLGAQMYFPFRGRLIREGSTQLDMREQTLTVEDYYALQERLPGCEIRWNIPIGSQIFDSTAREIVLMSLEEEDIPLFSLFDGLEQIHAENLECYDALWQLQESLPGCRVQWGIHMAGKSWSPIADRLDVTGTGASWEELMADLAQFPALTQVEYRDMPFTASEKAELAAAYPQVRFLWDVEVSGKTWHNTDKVLSYAGEKVDVAALAAAAEAFLRVEELDLTGSGCTVEELLILCEAFPDAFIKSEVSLWGQVFTTEAEKLDFSGTKLPGTAELEKLMPLMRKLTWVDMCGCGIADEEMDALNKNFPDTRFVWEVRFSVYTLRTDATFFCASDLPSNGYVAIKMTDAQLAPLKYCEDLIALDLGHMRYTDLSFLENMPKLQYLILVEAKFTDITPIGTLKDLKYLEIFVNTIDDLSPLLNCTQLRHLNIGYTSGFDTSVLKQFTYLERLWYPGNHMSEQEREELAAALPDTQCHLVAGDPDGSTGNGWREADIYFEMRNIFNMHYMPGGTGMGKDK